VKQNISQKKQNLEHQKQMEGVCCLQPSFFFLPRNNPTPRKRRRPFRSWPHAARIYFFLSTKQQLPEINGGKESCISYKVAPITTDVDH